MISKHLIVIFQTFIASTVILLALSSASIAFAQTCQTSCSACTTRNTCGNTTYDTCNTNPCTASGATGSTTFTCFASGNSNCQGTYFCGSCAPAPTPTPTPTPTPAPTCQTSCSACTKITTCGNTTYNTCDTSPCKAPGATSSTLFSCYASANSNCQGSYRCGSCVPTPTPTPTPTRTPTPTPTRTPTPTPTPTPTSGPTSTPTPTPTSTPTPTLTPSGPTGIGSCGTGTTRATGLVSTPDFTSGSKFGTSGGCVINPRAAFLEIPTFDRLKSLYFDQSKAAKSTITTLPASFSSDGLYNVTGDLTVNSTPTGTNTQVIFVNGKLDITANYAYGSATSGTVFVVKGNVNIAQSVTQIDAVIIAEGKIYTAGASCSPTTPVSASQLIINGSFISVSEGSKIEFCRKLGESGALKDSTDPAEKIVHQVKYLVILRNLLSDTVQKWSEIP